MFRASVIFSKMGKSNKTNASSTSLANSLGGASAMKSSSPICSGRYNSTTAEEVRVKSRGLELFCTSRV